MKGVNDNDNDEGQRRMMGAHNNNWQETNAMNNNNDDEGQQCMTPVHDG